MIIFKNGLIKKLSIEGSDLDVELLDCKVEKAIITERKEPKSAQIPGSKTEETL